MTKTQKEKWLERLFGIVSAIIVSLAIYSFTFTHDASYQEQKKIKEDIVKLDKEKASSEYVDQKCIEVKKDIEKQLTSTDARLSRIEETTQNIYNYLLNQKK